MHSGVRGLRFHVRAPRVKTRHNVYTRERFERKATRDWKETGLSGLVATPLRSERKTREREGAKELFGSFILYSIAGIDAVSESKRERERGKKEKRVSMLFNPLNSTPPPL